MASAHQPLYFGYLGTLHKLASCDVWIDWDDVQAEDSGFENRTRIRAADGREHYLTVPVRKSRDVKLKDVEICWSQPWRRKHWRTLEQAYGKAPNWPTYGPWLKWLYDQNWIKLADLNETIFDFLAVQFRLQNVRRMKMSSLGLTTHKSQAIVDACRKVGAFHYLFGAMGKDYADAGLFHAAGLEPWIQRYVPQQYPQGRDGFLPNLFPLDLLMHVERDRAIEIMMAGGKVARFD